MILLCSNGDILFVTQARLLAKDWVSCSTDLDEFPLSLYPSKYPLQYITEDVYGGPTTLDMTTLS